MVVYPPTFEELSENRGYKEHLRERKHHQCREFADNFVSKFAPKSTSGQVSLLEDNEETYSRARDPQSMFDISKTDELNFTF